MKFSNVSFLAVLFVAAVVIVAAVAPAAAQTSHSTHNETYLDPELDVDRMVDRFETEGREVFDLREPIVAALAIEPGMVVADIGAGTGAFLDPLVAAVGEQGHVFLADISIRFVEHLRDRVSAAGYRNVTTVLSAFESATLPANSIDLLFACDTYHHFDDHQAMLASMLRALRPGGTMVIVDFDRVEGKSRPWILEHVRASKRTFTDEILTAGFELVEEVKIEGMVDNFFLRFRKPIE